MQKKDLGITKAGGKVSAKAKAAVRSMTGYGKASVKSPFGTINVEVKSLNHKHLSISCSNLDGFFLLEERIKEIFEGKILRGKIFVNIELDSSKVRKPLDRIMIDKELAKVYLSEIKRMQKETGITGDMGISEIIKLPGVIRQNNTKAEEELWPYIRKAVDASSDQLVKFREEEGGKLLKDFMARVKRIKKFIQEIKVFERGCIEDYKTKLSRMIKEATEKEEVDKMRLEEEVALFARNCDIAEEIVRLQNHIETYNESLNNSKEDIGKKLDFVAQEMHREINTIGSKASDYRISNAVIEIKSEIEKMREQLKNIE
jgi:uncharacterized protein (TIGR00255 family)